VFQWLHVLNVLQVLKVHHGNGVRRSDLASICTGLSHLEDLAPKKKTHSADSAGQIFQRSRKSAKRLSAKFTSTWGPAPHMMGTLTKQSGSSWTWAEMSRGVLFLELRAILPQRKSNLEPELEANLKHRKKYRTSLWHVQNLKFIEVLIEPKGSLNRFKLDSLQVYTGFKVPSNFLAFNLGNDYFTTTSGDA
jgi:hypothetical protein